jgi:GGDEF domain-containing protein
MTDEKAYDLASKIGVAFGTEIVATQLGKLRSTVSGGIGFGEASGSSLDNVLAEADAALYAAKRAGRNCVISRKRMSKADPVEPALRSA